MSREDLGNVNYEGDALTSEDEVSFTVDPENQCGELFISIPVGDSNAISQVGRAKVNKMSTTFYGPDNVTSSLSLPTNDELIEMLEEADMKTENFDLDTSEL